VTNADIVEMMAFERIEPFGALADEYRLGTIPATFANVNRGKDDDPYEPADFMPALRKALGRDEVKVVGQDLSADQLSALIDAQIFGRTVH
jgi:hypothetical protein